MLASGDFEGPFQLTREAGYKKENEGKQIGVKLIYKDTDSEEVIGKEVSWILSDWTQTWNIITDIKSRCMSCIYINKHQDYCSGPNNSGSLWDNLTSYYICPDFEENN